MSVGLAGGRPGLSILPSVVLSICFVSVLPAQVTLNVVGSDGKPVGGYRWLIEEDRTYHVQPGVFTPNTLSLDFHASYMPVVGKGEGSDNGINEATPLFAINPATGVRGALDRTKHYYVSVLPKTAGTYTIGGAQIAPGQTQVTVRLNKLPLPTAQITIFVFEDKKPINNIADLPEEVGLPGFSVVLEDAGGRYGISAGTQTQDAFGNPLGTVYAKDANGNYLLDPDGNPIPATDSMGNPIVEPLVTGPCPGPTCGTLTIKNLHPGKYGVTVVPPAGQGWQQTSTIEGTRVIDAWVKANEPPFFQEFGPAGWHVAIGFIKPFADASVLKGGATISGKIVNNHLSRPPDYAFYNGSAFEHTTAWVGLNDAGGQPGVSKGVYAARANGDGTFSIPNVPPGSYQLVVWDDNVDLIFASTPVTVTPSLTCNALSSCNLGDVPVFNWFTSTHHYVFFDANENGFRDPGEPGMPDQLVNLRWRDGTVYQSLPTDMTGFVPFDEIFPFFAWQVAEVDFTRFKPTGVTVVVDNGGPIPFTNPLSFDGKLSPQPQCAGTPLPGPLQPNGCPPGTSPVINPYTNNHLVRTEVGPVLTQAFQGFLGQTSVFMWGKSVYKPGENGGIAGVVYYDTTRAENDPAKNFAEPWSPGIPDIEVRLWDSTGAKLLNRVFTDSWDKNKPSGCQGEPFYFNGVLKDCYDGLRNFNQVRPGLFDGSYAFTAYCADPNGMDKTNFTCTNMVDGIPGGQYIVEIVLPKDPLTGKPALYDIVKEEDKNVDFGDNYTPSPQLEFWPCVGNPAELGHSAAVPAELSLFPGVPTANPGQPRKLCNKKMIYLNQGSNGAVDFFLFTEVPVAGHISGMILDDASNEFDPNSPNFGEKYSPPFLPVSIRDWTGIEIGRVYADKFGRFNALVPSTYTKNRPSPSGVAPGMVITCMNSRTRADGTQDPFWNPQYSEFCYTFQYMPGATTYLDTPVVPVAAHAGPNQKQLDCELPNGTPRIKQVSVNNLLGGGPLVTAPGQIITIQAMGRVAVPNPAYCPGPPLTTADACPVINTIKTVYRDYGFGTTKGKVTVGGVELTNVTWGANQITATVPAGVTTGQLVITRGDNNKSTIAGLTVYVGTDGGAVRYVVPKPGGCDGSPANPCPIQQAIDAARDGDLILVTPGVYQEMVVVYKAVRLQGYGEGSTTIDAAKVPQEKLQNWRNKVEQLVATNQVTLLPGQEIGGIANGEPVMLFTEEGAGILVLPRRNAFKAKANARIDGFTITGADTGGGIVVNGYADYLEISNNRITNNSGVFGGGIRLGHPQLTEDNITYTNAENNFVRIHHNKISLNGGLGGAGGGISICTGADDYQVTDNFICGNFSMGDGGGIAHLGLSDRGLIARNTVLFNENFNQGITVAGGGILIAGQPPLAPQTQSPGSGSVKVIGNRIQGNMAGAGDGGGIRLSRVNGADVAGFPNQQNHWYQVDILNNMIVNNVTALAGGGISLQDALKVNILHNTIALNDSTATASLAFSLGTSNQSAPQPAGIVSRGHSAALASIPGTGTYSNPNLQDNIIWHNRSFYFEVVQTLNQPDQYVLRPAVPEFNDLAVLGAAGTLSPKYSLLTGPDSQAPDPNGNKTTTNPWFVSAYENGHAGVTLGGLDATTSITPPPAFDEGGNFIRVRFGPLTLNPCSSFGPPDWSGTNSCRSWLTQGDYHILPGSPAVDSGFNLTAAFPDLATDIDGQARPLPPSTKVDMGADEGGAPPAGTN